jgi:tol-pal system-associated acyl-CoA thioesterase
MAGDALNKEFSLPIRVYIEDTDAGGIVYYVNYLKFMERARTEYMREGGFGKNFIFNRDLMFVVQDVKIQYLQPAQLDDELQATARVTRVRGASMVLEQAVQRGDTVLAQGEVRIACVDKTSLKPRRLPAEILASARDATL